MVLLIDLKEGIDGRFFGLTEEGEIVLIRKSPKVRSLCYNPDTLDAGGPPELVDFREKAREDDSHYYFLEKGRGEEDFYSRSLKYLIFSIGGEKEILGYLH